MGANESLSSSSSTNKHFGFRIYNIIPNGPLHKANITPLDDFMLPPEEMFTKNIPFSEYIKNKAGTNITLNIYSLSKRGITPISLQVNPIGSEDGFLGGSVRYENYITAEKKLLHVLKVKSNSFSETKLHLEEGNDYLIALRPDHDKILTLNEVNHNNPLELFSKMIKANKGKECDFYIYNKYKGSRCISATIDNNDTHFEMGCDVAYGMLHEFPLSSSTNDIDDDDEKEKLREQQC
jgi:hypothetical protein